ncbi:FUSC family protein [Cupriavidus sp. AU9028]|nr:FUSC family protein [Cupriavidus sp. AU9028]
MLSLAGFSFRPGDYARFWRRGLVYGLSFLALAWLAWLEGDRGLFWSATASIWTCLADPGGTARRRLQAMGAVALGGALASTAGAALAGMPALALVLVVMAGLAAGMMEIRGPVAALCAKLLYVVLIASMLQPLTEVSGAWWAGGANAVGVAWLPLRAGIDFLAGGLFASLFCLALLPSAYDGRPRTEIVAAYAALDTLARRLASVQEDGAPSEARLNADKRRIREALEQALAAVQSRRGWFEATALLHYRYLAAMADALFALLIVAAELRGRPGYAKVPWRHLARCLEDLRAQLRDGLKAHGPDLPALTRASHRQLRHLHGQLANGGAPPLYQAALSTLARFGAFEDWRGAFRWPRPSLWLTLRQCRQALVEHLARDARVSRHALRLAFAGGLSLLPGHLLELDHGYWVAVTVIMVLTPQLQTTRRITLQRFAGSLAGALLATLMVFMLALGQVPPWLALPISAGCLGLAYSARLAGHLGVFASMLTPAVILFSWIGEPGADGSHFAALRGLDTALGCLIALASYALLTQRAEVSRARRFTLDALEVHAIYLRAAFSAALDRHGASQREASLEAMRVAAGRASVRAEQCLEQAGSDIAPATASAFASLHATLRRMAALAGLLRAEASGGEEAGSVADATRHRVDQVRAALATLAVRPGLQDLNEADREIAGARARAETAHDRASRDVFLQEQVALAWASIAAAHADALVLRVPRADAVRPARR